MSKMGQELERKLDENKYKLLKGLKELLQELKVFMKDEGCDHEIQAYIDEFDKLIADIEGGNQCQE